MVWCCVALTLLWLVASWHDGRAVRTLPDLPPLPPATPPAAVTVVIPVRDGAGQITEVVTRFLAQRHVDLRLVVVDDRSTDGTSARLAEFARHDPRLAVTTVRELPPDWLGKSHALQVGAATTTTPWLLFADADAWLGPDALARAIAAAEAHAADHVALLPDHRARSWLGEACLLAFHLTVQRRVAAVNAARQRSFVGTGAFNLVRTAAWRAVGEHHPLRLEVVDDVYLGALLFRAGFRSRVWFAARDLAIDWGGTPTDLLRVVEKNMFAMVRFRTWLALLLLLLTTALLAVTFTAPWWCGPLGWAALGAYATTALPAARFARRLGWRLAPASLVPLTRLWLVVALARSAWITLRQRGVRWRGTFYPLAQLRRGMVR